MGLKIGEISKKSGVAPSTIRYYVRQGLLPEPDKVNKSMAYYDERCIEKIHAIRHLQERKYFPLSVIKNILRRMDQGMGLEEAEAIEDAVFGAQEGVPEKVMERSEFLDAISFGQDMHELRFYVDLGKQIVDHEMNLRRAAVKNRPSLENIRITTEISKVADLLRSYILRRLFQRRVQAAIQKSLPE